MGLKEDIVDLTTQTNEIEKSLAMELIEYSKQQNRTLEKQNEHLEKSNRRLYILLLVIVILWFATMLGGYYYFTHFGIETEIETADTNDGGNACVGDNCYNGDISYGESNKSK